MPDITEGWIRLYRRLLVDRKFRRLSFGERSVWIMYLLIARWKPPFRGWLYDSIDEDPRPLSLRDRANLLGVSPGWLARVDAKLSSPPLNMLSRHESTSHKKPNRFYIRNYPKYQGGDPDEKSCVHHVDANGDANGDLNVDAQCLPGEHRGQRQSPLEGKASMAEDRITDGPEASQCPADGHTCVHEENTSLCPSGGDDISPRSIRSKEEGLTSFSGPCGPSKDGAEHAPAQPFKERHEDAWAAWWLGENWPGRTTREIIERYEAVGAVAPIKPVELEEAEEVHEAIAHFGDGAAYRALELCIGTNPGGLARQGVTFIIEAMRIGGPRSKEPRKKPKKRSVASNRPANERTGE